MSHRNTSVLCLAIRAYRRRDGAIDVAELTDFLDHTVGIGQWLATKQWLFQRPPEVFRPGFLSVPVVCPQETAVSFRASDEAGPRLFGVGRVEGVHLDQWRWLAFQTHPDPDRFGVFPWQQADQARGAHA